MPVPVLFDAGFRVVPALQSEAILAGACGYGEITGGEITG